VDVFGIYLCSVDLRRSKAPRAPIALLRPIRDAASQAVVMRQRPNPGITILDGQPASDRLSTTSTVAQKLRNVERFRTVPVESCFQRSVAVFRSGEGADGDGTRLYPSPICRTCSIAANDGDKQSCQHGDKDRRTVVATGHTRRRHSCVWVVQCARWAATGGAQWLTSLARMRWTSSRHELAATRTFARAN